jgi:eukaryotic-like serine/threonine-protein kinase
MFLPAIVRAVERLSALGRRGEAALALELLASAHETLGDAGARMRALEKGAELARSAGWRSLARALESAAGASR